MNIWLWFALGFALAVLPCVWLLARAQPVDGLVALQCASGICTLTLVLLAQGLARPSFFDIALTLALLTYPSTLLFAHFLERWL